MLRINWSKFEETHETWYVLLGGALAAAGMIIVTLLYEYIKTGG